MTRSSCVLVTVLTGVVGLFSVGPGIHAQEVGNDCNPRSFRVINSRAIAAGQRVTWVGLPDVVCPNGVRIQADSAVIWEAAGRTEFLGRFRYQDPEQQLRSMDADYWEREGRLEARGDVQATTRGGETEIRGDMLTLYRAPQQGGDDRIIVFGRPAFALIQPSDSADTSPTPYEVTGLNLRFEGDRFFYANDDVEVDRDSLHATTRSLSFDRMLGSLVLRGDARVESGSTVFEGDTIDLRLPDDELTSMNIRRGGKILGEDLDLTGEEIQIDFTEGEIEHLTAFRGQAPQVALAEEPESLGSPGDDDADGDTGREEPPRPEALADDFYLTADSIEVDAPGGVLETVFAYGRARAESGGVMRGDTLAVVEIGDVSEEAPGMESLEDSLGIDIRLLDQDWIEGDTIVARFSRAGRQMDSLAVIDTTGMVDAQLFDATADPSGTSSNAAASVEMPEGSQGGEGREYVLTQLVAIGNARTLYRSPPDEVPGDSAVVAPPGREKWAISYLLADQIVLTLSEGQVEHVLAEGTVSGIQLEPEEEDVEPEEEDVEPEGDPGATIEPDAPSDEQVDR